MNALGLLEWPIPYSPTHDGKISVNKRRKFQVLFPLSTHIAYKPTVSFFLWWKVPAFSLCLCVCVSLSHTHTYTFKRFCVWLIFFCLRLWLLISTFLVIVFRVKSPIQFNRLEKIKTSSLHLFFWNLCLLVYILLSYSWLCWVSQ